MLVLELLARAENASNLILDLRSSSCMKDSLQFSQELISFKRFLSQFSSIWNRKAIFSLSSSTLDLLELLLLPDWNIASRILQRLHTTWYLKKGKKKRKGNGRSRIWSWCGCGYYWWRGGGHHWVTSLPPPPLQWSFSPRTPLSVFRIWKADSFRQTRPRRDSMPGKHGLDQTHCLKK